MAGDEIWGGRDEQPSPGPDAATAAAAGTVHRRLPLRWRNAGGTAVLVAVLVAAVVHGHDTPPVRPAPVPGAAPVVPVDATLPADVELVDVRLDALCLPVTDGREKLTLSFVLSNAGRRSLPVLDVLPLLPLGGLRPLSRSMVYGDCTTEQPPPTDRLLHVDATLRVTFVFGLPPTCPASLPVLATVRVRRQDHAVDQRLPVFLDLTAVPDFATC